MITLAAVIPVRPNLKISLAAMLTFHPARVLFWYLPADVTGGTPPVISLAIVGGQLA
jgi:hypothetical protein